MSVFKHIDMVPAHALAVLENNLGFTKQVNRQYSSEFAKAGAQIGSTLNIRKPTKYTVRTTTAYSAQATVESTVPLVLDKTYGVDIPLNSTNLTLEVNDFVELCIKPAVASIANKIDYDGLQLYKSVYSAVGTPGTTPSSNLTYLQAGVKLSNQAAPMDGNRAMIVDPLAQATIVNANLAQFNPPATISEQYLKGSMGTALGYKWSMDQNVGRQTTGTFAAAASGAGTAVTVTTTVSSGSSIVTGGWTSGDQLKAGDIIRFSNVYTVNPQNRVTTGQLQQFVVTADATASGGGAMTISVSPELVFSGAFQNVYSATGTLASGTVLTVEAASATQSTENLLFHRDAFTFANVDLAIPEGVIGASRIAEPKNGLSIRAIYFYDGYNDVQNLRLDVLGGWLAVRPELACRVRG